MRSIYFRPSLPCTLVLAIAATLLGVTFVCPAAQTRTNAPAKPLPPAATKTNAVPAEPEIPKSVFMIPSTPQEGKDPFYPRSTRLFASVVIPAASTTHAPSPTVELQLKALSGTSNSRLAIINNHTFAVGEVGEVVTNTGRFQVRCLDIKEDSVLVLVGGEQRVLHLRPGI
jgi:hypothetical protein